MAEREFLRPIAVPAPVQTPDNFRTVLEVSDHLVEVVKNLTARRHRALVPLLGVQVRGRLPFPPDPIDELGMGAIFHQIITESVRKYQ